jgi:predicted nucleic acid-binding protein
VKYLLDTNVVSEWVKAAPDPGVVAFTEETDEDAAFLSVVTLAELQFGVERLAEGARRKRLEQWLAGELAERFEGRVLGLDRAAAVEWGKLMAQAQRAGRPMSEMDAWIAATAKVHGFTIVTRNHGDFEAAGCATMNPWTEEKPK